MRVRFANEGDVHWILPELRQFSGESGLLTRFFPEDEKDAADIVSNLIADHLFIVTETEDEQGTGFIAGVLTPHILNPRVACCYELFWWVKKEFRRSRAGLMLLLEFTSFCKEHVDFANISLLTTSPDLSRSLNRLGWREVERQFTLEVSDGSYDSGNYHRSGECDRCRRSGSPTAADCEESRGHGTEAGQAAEAAPAGEGGE